MSNEALNPQQFGRGLLGSLPTTDGGTKVPYWDWDELKHADASGGITPEVQHAFLNGACHGLAAHIHDIAGHPIGRVYFAGDSESPEETTHYFNYDKDNPRYGFDINGRRPVKDIIASLGMTGGKVAHRPVSVEEFHAQVQSNEDLAPVNHAATRKVATDVLSRKGNSR